MPYARPTDAIVARDYEQAKERYAELDVDVEAALKTLASIPLSMHCWQGDDVGGFENTGLGLTGGIMATGSHPGKARTIDELRVDAEKAMSLIPGPKKFNLHAIYLDAGGKKVERDEVAPEHFLSWIDWAKSKSLGLDFNPTFFSHEKAATGFTLSNADKSARDFWIAHAKACRKVAESFTTALGSACVLNFWIPDGTKDCPADRWSPRRRLEESLDAIFAEKISPSVKEAVEGKLFGIGSEEYVVGSNDFYLAYAVTRRKLPCLDMGHYHPTETIHDKISAVLRFCPEALIHVSRPIRWDSDHIVLFNDELAQLCREIVRGEALSNVYLATDFFDASVNRIAAWSIGLRSLSKALLSALLEPIASLKALEAEGARGEMLALSEECRTMPIGAVWNRYCADNGVPVGPGWIDDVKSYERDVLLKRS